jgi:rare lipoprotein A
MVAGCATAPAPKPQVPLIPPPEAALPSSGAYKIGAPYQVDGVWYYPSENYSYREEGIASWYGDDFHGKRTANGEEQSHHRSVAPCRAVAWLRSRGNGTCSR